jgi:hypothetical protein
MVHRAYQAGYHYVATPQKRTGADRGEQIELLAVEGQKLKWAVAEIFKDHSARTGIGRLHGEGR